MTKSPRRVVARSTETSAVIPAIQFLGAATTLRHAQSEIHDRLGLVLPTVEPEYHLFPHDSSSVAAAMRETPADTPARTLRCVIEVERGQFITHGTAARPVVLVQVGDCPKGWSSPLDETYDIVVCVTPHQVKQLLVDLFLDFSMSSSNHLRDIFEAYIGRFGFNEYGRRKAEFARAIPLSETRFGPVAASATYVNFSSLTNAAGVRDLDALVDLWECFALDAAFKSFATVEDAVVSLRNRRIIGRKLEIGNLRRCLSDLDSGIYAIVGFTPQLGEPTRDAFNRAKSFLAAMDLFPDTSIGNHMVVASADALWKGFSRTRKDLLRLKCITIERFVIQR